MVGEAGQLVGERLAVQRLVAVDVGGRDGGLLAQVGEQVALLRAERARRRAPRRRRRRAPARCRSARPAPSAVLLDGDDCRRARRWRSASAEHGGQRVGASCTAARGSSRAPRDHARAAGAGVERLDRGAGDDLQQRVEVEVGGEGVADAAHRDPQPVALALERLQPVVRTRDAPFAVAGHVGRAAGRAAAGRGGRPASRRRRAPPAGRAASARRRRPIPAPARAAGGAGGRPRRATRAPMPEPRSNASWAAKATPSRVIGALRGSCQPAATSTSAGPSACTALPPQRTSRSKRARPQRHVGQRARAPGRRRRAAGRAAPARGRRAGPGRAASAPRMPAPNGNDDARRRGVGQQHRNDRHGRDRARSGTSPTRPPHTASRIAVRPSSSRSSREACGRRGGSTRSPGAASASCGSGEVPASAMVTPYGRNDARRSWPGARESPKGRLPLVGVDVDRVRDPRPRLGGHPQPDVLRRFGASPSTCRTPHGPSRRPSANSAPARRPSRSPRRRPRSPRRAACPCPGGVGAEAQRRTQHVRAHFRRRHGAAGAEHHAGRAGARQRRVRVPLNDGARRLPRLRALEVPAGREEVVLVVAQRREHLLGGDRLAGRGRGRGGERRCCGAVSRPAPIVLSSS